MLERQRQTQLCPMCQRSMHLNYYCESCHSSFCSDCIKEKQTEFLICSNCGSEKISRNKEGILKCDSCFSQNTTKVYKNVKICPKCNSSLIVKVFEKKKQINEKYIQLIRNTRSFIIPFRELINKLSLLRNKLKKVREPPFKCYHFPSLEAELITLYRLFIHVKKEVYENIRREYDHIFMNRNYFIDISTQSNTNIPIIIGILENLNHEHKSLSIFIENNLKKISDKIQEIDAKIKFLEDIRNNFQKFNSIIEFTRDEKALYAVRCKLAKGFNPLNEYSNERGTLLISNLYIYFIHEYGLLKKRVEFIFKIPHEEFKRIQITGTVRKKLYMEFVYGKYYFSIPSSKRKDVIEYIENARVFDENQRYDIESSKSLMMFKLDVKDLIDFIEMNISYLLNLKCSKNPDYLPNYQMNYGENYNYNHPRQNYNNPYVNNFQGNQFAQPNRNYRNQNDFHFNENNILMRKLEDYQRPYNPQYPPNINPNNFINQNTAAAHPYQVQKNYFNPEFNNMDLTNPNSLNQRFLNRGHLYLNQRGYQEDNKRSDFDKRTLLLELEKEEFSLNQTLKHLERKFQKSEISEVDYFRTYRSYQQELFVIERKIQDLKMEIDEEEAFKKYSSDF